LLSVTGEHGLDHPGVVIDVPRLQCKCKDSHHASTSGREYGGDERSSQASACREEGEVYWIVSVRGLVPGFVYEVHFVWSLERSGENSYHWKTGFTSSTSSYTVRYLLQRIQKTRVMNIDESVSDAYTAQKAPFVVEVNLRDMHPGLTSEEALIGTRRLDSSVNTVRVHCADLESGEREEPLDLSPENTASDDTASTGGGGSGGSDDFLSITIASPANASAYFLRNVGGGGPSGGRGAFLDSVPLLWSVTVAEGGSMLH